MVPGQRLPLCCGSNKLDKVKKSQIAGNLEVIRQDLELPEECPVIPFSAEKGNGREELVRMVLAAVKDTHIVSRLLYGRS